MKKKLLSLVLAGAMVASTSVSAFAEDTQYDIATGDKEHKVNIEGNIEDTTGATVPGTINVTVPTAVSFTVGADGQITGGDIKIKNTSDKKVEVVAKEFTDTTANTGIVIVKETELDDKIDENDGTKRHISLKLTGDKSLGLISAKTNGKTGFVNENEAEIGPSENTSLGYAWRENDLTLHLTGRAKKSDASTYSAPTTAVRDTFNLVLKIQKAR